MQKKFYFAIIAFVLMVQSAAITSQAAPGDLDFTFDEDGKVITAPGFDVHANDIAIQSDGKVIVAGGRIGNQNNTGFIVARYNTDGSLDTSFDGDGIVRTFISDPPINETALSVAIQSDGKIVVAGNSRDSAQNKFGVVRYNTNGSLDTSFDGDGKVMTLPGGGSSQARAVAIQSNGKIVVAGLSYAFPSNDFAIVRYNPDGSLDSLFGTGGIVATDFGGNEDAAQAVAIQPDGKIVAAGYTNAANSIAVARYIGDSAPTAASVSVGGRVLTSSGAVLRNAMVTLSDAEGNTRTARTSSFGYYRFDDVLAGESYLVSVTSKRYSYAPQFITLLDELADLDFTPEP